MSEDLHRIVHAWRERGGAGVVCVERGGELLLEYVATQPGQEPLAGESGFDVGSLTKPFTAAAVFQLEAEGALTLDDPLGRFFAEAPADKRALTLRELVTHTSGLGDLIGEGGRALAAEEYDPDAFDYVLVEREELVRRVLGSELRFSPGERYAYSNAGYGLLGVVVELASAAPYERYVRERVLLPAGLERTGYLEPGWRPEECAVGYRDGRRWGTPLDRLWFPDGPSWNLRAAGGFISTAAELVRWPAALAAGNALAPSARERYLELFTRESARGTRIHSPAGSNGVFTAVLVWDVDAELVLAATASVAEADALELAQALVPAALATG